MSKDELEKIYEQLDAATEQLRAIALVLQDIRAKLASGGGPADR